MYELVEIAAGRKPADILFKNCKVIDVHTGKIESRHLAIAQEYIVGYGEYEAYEVIDLKGKFVAPSLIDAHIHIESSLLAVDEFAKTVVPLGTGTIIADPHEFANVLGKQAFEYMLKKRENLPLDIFVMASSCVPATPFDNSACTLKAADLACFKNHERLLGLAEMMNYPGVLFGDDEVYKKLELFSDSKIDGHAPLVSGKDLCAYRIAGPDSEHESTSRQEAYEKLSVGIHVHIREGSTERNLDEILPIVTKLNSRHFSFACDDRHPLTLKNEGHIDNSVRKALAQGLDPVMVFQMASLNTAQHYGLKDKGALSPGFVADMIVFDSLKDFRVETVYKRGIKVAENGKALFDYTEELPKTMFNTVHLEKPKVTDFEIKADGSQANVIDIIPHQILTKKSIENLKIVDGLAISDIQRDIIKVAVFERHRKTGNIGLGFVRGFNLKKGVLASSVGHDSHNIIVMGENDSDMAKAVCRLCQIGGGYVCVIEDEIVAELPLPVAGLVSELPLQEVIHLQEKLDIATKEMGIDVEEPFSILSFLPLTPVPEIRINDSGLFDVSKFSPTELFIK